MELPRENIRWDLHNRHLQSMFALHLMQGRFCDVTLACKDGQTIRAHRTILCACSGYFDAVLTGEASGKDVLVIMKDCDYQDIRLIIQFMYYGEINVDEHRLRSLRKTAEGFQIKGLTDAFLNFNDDDLDLNLNNGPVTSRPVTALPESTHRTISELYSNDTANAGPKIVNVEGAVALPVADSDQEGQIVPDEADWSVNQDANDFEMLTSSDDGCDEDDLSFDTKIESYAIEVAQDHSTPGTSTQNSTATLPQPPVSSSSKPALQSPNATVKQQFLQKLRSSIDRKYNGRIRNFVPHDIIEFSIENNNGKCLIKCPICNKRSTLLYRMYESQHVKKPQWYLHNFYRHLEAHFKGKQ